RTRCRVMPGRTSSPAARTRKPTGWSSSAATTTRSRRPVPARTTNSPGTTEVLKRTGRLFTLKGRPAPTARDTVNRRILPILLLWLWTAVLVAQEIAPAVSDEVAESGTAAVTGAA